MKQTTKKTKDNKICCMFCGKIHERNKNKCPVFGKKCKKCGKENHFAAKSKSRTENGRKSKPIQVVAEQDSDAYEHITTIKEVRDSKPGERATVKTNNSLQE